MKEAPSNPAFMLARGSLKHILSDTCELVDIREFWDVDYLGYKTMKTSMVARKK